MGRRKLRAVLLLGACASIALAHCVGDDSTTNDAGPDSTAVDATPDVAKDVTSGGDAADADAGNPCVTSDAGGTLDQTFNTGVKNLGSFTPNAAVVDSAGLIYVGGIQGSGCPQVNSGAVYRFTETGSLDTTYNAADAGAAGHVCIHYDVVDSVYALAIDRTGRLVAGGLSFDGNAFEHATVTRLKTDGTLDTTFNATGKLDVDPKANTTHIGIGAVQGIGFLSSAFNDKIVITGSPEATQVNLGKTNTGFVIRLGDDGAIDSAFASSGVFKDTTVDGFYRVHVDANATITTVGSTNAVPKAMVVRQLGLSGAPVASFGDAGVFTMPLNQNFGDDGREIVVVGSRILAGASVDFVNNANGFGRVGVVALTSSGALDTTWGGNDAGVQPGVFMSNADLGWQEYFQITALATECDGKLLTGATHLDVDAATNNSQDLEVRRLTVNGAIDTTFGNGGHAIFSLTGNEIAVAVAQDPTTSRIVIVGRDGTGNTVLARFLP